MADQDRRSKIKRIVQENEGIGKTKAAELASRPQERLGGVGETKAAELPKDDMSTRTAFRIIDDLVKEGEIIERKVGKTKQLRPLEGDVGRLADEIDGFIEYLSGIKKEIPYPYDMSNAILHEITEQRDNLERTKNTMQYELSENAIADVMIDYHDYREKARKFMRHLNPDLESKVDKFWNSMSRHLSSTVRERGNLTRERAKYGQGEKRNLLSARIYDLKSRENQLWSDVVEMYHLLKEIKEDSSDKERLPMVLEPTEMVRLKYAKQFGKKCQDEVVDMLDIVSKRQADQKSGQAPEQDPMSGLEETKKILENIREELDEADAKLVEWYKSTFLNKLERQAYQLCQKYADGRD